MLSELSNILQLYALPGMIFGFGLCFFFIHIPRNEGLHGYKMARKMTGGAYLICSLALIAEAQTLGGGGGQSAPCHCHRMHPGLFLHFCTCHAN